MAYASIVCLINTLDENIQLNLIPQNSQCIQILLKEASLFQDFLEKTSHKSSETATYLESRIRDAAYKAQDIVESQVADQLLQKSGTRAEVCFKSIWRILRSICRSISRSNTSLSQQLDEVMEEINSIKQEVMQIGKKEKDKEEEEEEENNDEPHVQSSISLAAGTSRRPSHGMTTNTMVGLDDHLKEIKTRLVSGSSQREIIALVGMGGIGKTTLAQKVYNEEPILSHFDTCRWVTVSQEYSMQSIIAGLLGREKICQENSENLKLELYQSLKNMRYLIVLDDMWDTKVWEGLKRVLPDDDNGSRILLTTRLEQVAKHENSSPLEYMRFLDDRESWGLFCEVFGRDCCSPELEKVGMEIVKNCRGLPLAIKVIGGHLSKATRTKHYWRSVAKNLSETIALENDGQCSRILSLSYKYLPHHLKSCFLYMSIFPEDCVIKVHLLLNLWIASGLIKQHTSKSSDDVAKEYLLDLIERNLIFVSHRKYNGKIMECKIHDLIRDLCVEEAKNERFFYITNKTFCYDHYCGVDHVRVALHSGGLRAFYCHHYRIKHHLPTMVKNQANLRYLYHSRNSNEPITNSDAIPFHKFVHLHTIHSSKEYVNSEANIWEMPQLRHVKTSRITLPRPPSEIEGGSSLIVLEKLETLTNAWFFILTDEVLLRIPNLKKLGVHYYETEAIGWRYFHLDNLERLQKLESLSCTFHTFPTSASILLGPDITFPHSIRKLKLEGSRIPWKDMAVVGSLPNLQVLKLNGDAFVGQEWEPNEGEFLNLTTLRLDDLNLVHWRAEADHFPMLQHLFISYCKELQEIPSGVGEIPTLQLINVRGCRESVTSSTRQIEEEQHNFGNEGIQVIIRESHWDSMCYF